MIASILLRERLLGIIWTSNQTAPFEKKIIKEQKMLKNKTFWKTKTEKSKRKDTSSETGKSMLTISSQATKRYEEEGKGKEFV